MGKIHTAPQRLQQRLFYIHIIIHLFAKKDNLRISIARAGNVVGGGDWSDDRLVPDIVKSWSKNKTVNIRNLKSTRPWQHVLEAIFGYLLLCYNLNKKEKILMVRLLILDLGEIIIIQLKKFLKKLNHYGRKKVR